MPNHKKVKHRGKKLIFRRYKTLKDGTILDAYDYGYKAWPMWIKL